MKTMSKALAGSVVAVASALSAASPAIASDSHGADRGGILAAAGNTSHYGNDYDFTRAGYRGWEGRNGDGSERGMSPRQAVQICTSQAEAMASRHSIGRADVTDVRDVRNTGWGGFEVRGRIAVNAMGHTWRNGDNRYGNGWNNNQRGHDSGSFTCKVERGRVIDMNFDGIRGF